MSTPYPRALRERVLAAYDRGLTQPEVCEQFSIGRTTLVRWVRLFRETGDVEPRPHGGGNPARVRMEVLEEVLAEVPDATRGELTKLYNKRVRPKERVHDSSVYRALKRHGYVFKKRGLDPQSKTVRTS
jgi:transposase